MIFKREETAKHTVFKCSVLRISVRKVYAKKNCSFTENRNFKRNVFVQMNGLHGYRPTKFRNVNLLNWFFYCKEWICFYLLRKISIPQVEFTLTTKCTLKCKNCTNYISSLKPDEHCTTSFEDFKIQVDNLTSAVNKIHNFLILGGEAFVLPNLGSYVEYAALNKKIKRIWLVTNATLLMNDDLRRVVGKYNKKITIWVSNYSQNPELKNVLKQKELLQQIKNTEADCYYKKNLLWSHTSPCPKCKIRKDSHAYFVKCLNLCMAVFAGKVFVCPRAGTFYLKGIYKPEAKELIDLNCSVSKQQIKEFYAREVFSACDFCSLIEDEALPPVLPAEQIN